MSKAEPTERIANALERIADSLEGLDRNANRAARALAWTAAREAAAAVSRTASHAAGGSYPSEALTKHSRLAREFSESLDEAALTSMEAMLFPRAAIVSDKVPTP